MSTFFHILPKDIVNIFAVNLCPLGRCFICDKEIFHMELCREDNNAFFKRYCIECDPGACIMRYEFGWITSPRNDAYAATFLNDLFNCKNRLRR